MNKLKVHNKRINAWLVVDCGKVYDEQTNIQVPKLTNCIGCDFVCEA